MIISPERAKKRLNFNNEKSNSILNGLEAQKETMIEKSEDLPQYTTNFGIYEFFLLVLTQCGYLPVAASLLSTTFFEPSKTFCNQVYNTTQLHDKDLSTKHDEFYSLLFEWNSICIGSSLNVQITTSVMIGAVFGSFMAGFMADRFGRKPVVVGTLMILAGSNLALLFVAPYGPRISLAVFFLKGCACGGYMVTNLVFILEAIRSERTRLLVASLNGWPIGMIFTGTLGYLTADWRLYCGFVALTSICLATLLYSRSFESVGWLDNRQKMAKATRIRQQIVERNQRLKLVTKLSFRSNGQQNTDEKDVKLEEAAIDEKQVSLENMESEKLAEILERRETIGSLFKAKTQTYVDLFRHTAIRRPLLALLFSFMTSSVVSFGFYFTTDSMHGSRYVNLAMMGALKFALGLLPFALSYLVSKKRIILSSVFVACVASWILIAVCTWMDALDSSVTTILGIAITASMDPTWKISHLYSVELFPTGVRNMARGACNVTARLGSLAGPLIMLFRSWNPLLPYWLFAILLTIQWFVLAFNIPKANSNDLSQEIPNKSRNTVVY